MLLIENNSLSLPADIASQYFKEDVMKLYQRDENKLKDMLCLLENVDYIYNSKNSIITNNGESFKLGEEFYTFFGKMYL